MCVTWSPCLLQHARETLDPRLKLYDQVSFIHDFPVEDSICKLPAHCCLHVTCSSTKMDLTGQL